MKIKKYICYGAPVTSINDGQEHMISARKVAELYKVDPTECYFVNWDEGIFHGGKSEDSLIGLWPRRNGDYNLDHEN